MTPWYQKAFLRDMNNGSVRPLRPVFVIVGLNSPTCVKLYVDRGLTCTGLARTAKQGEAEVVFPVVGRGSEPPTGMPKQAGVDER